MPPLKSRPFWGIKMGLYLSLFQLLMGALRAGTLRASILDIAALLLGGAVGGLSFGLLLPLARTRLGASVMGPVVLTPFVATLGFLQQHYSDGGAVSWSPYVFTILLVGPAAGFVVRDQVFPELDALSNPRERTSS